MILFVPAAIHFGDVVFAALGLGVIVNLVRVVRFVIRKTTKVVVSAAAESRPCPRCGKQVKAGLLDCADCGFDFRTIGSI